MKEQRPGVEDKDANNTPVGQSSEAPYTHTMGNDMVRTGRKLLE